MISTNGLLSHPLDINPGWRAISTAISSRNIHIMGSSGMDVASVSLKNATSIDIGMLKMNTQNAVFQFTPVSSRKRKPNGMAAYIKSPL
jgi:hypothetical protein